MPRKIREFLADILEHIANIDEFLASKDEQSFASDKQCLQSVYWSLFTISEAVTELLRQDASLSREISEHRDIRTVRNLLAHSYFAIKPDRVWDTCKNSLPILKSEVEAIIARF